MFTSSTLSQRLLLLLAVTVWALGMPRLSGITVSDEVNKTVVFIFAETAEKQYAPRGTGFLVSVPVEGQEDRSFTYLVTARHVLESAGKLLPLVRLRFNKKEGGGVSYVNLDLAAFRENGYVLQPDDASVDLSAVVLPAQELKEIADIKTIPSNMLIDREGDSDLPFSVGTEVFFTGLFTGHVGSDRNYPIARFGHVAMITDEKVTWKERGARPQELELFLVETATYGGNSGAPLFFHFGPDRTPGSIVLGPPILKLGGVVKGHFNDGQEIISVESDDTKQYSIHSSGISAVVPGYLVKELLFSNAAKSFRTEHR